MKFILLAAIAALAFAGCATGPKIDWNTRVGNFTYDQAVLELGPPDKVAKLDSGIIVANWITQRGHVYTSGGGIAYGGYPGTVIVPSYTQTSSLNYYLRLTFGADGKLTVWKKYAQ
jgi:PHP family Zn ribbon phosphoesterase